MAYGITVNSKNVSGGPARLLVKDRVEDNSGLVDFPNSIVDIINLHQDKSPEDVVSGSGWIDLGATDGGTTIVVHNPAITVEVDHQVIGYDRDRSDATISTTLAESSLDRLRFVTGEATPSEVDGSTNITDVADTGYTLGPGNNTFTGATKAAAETARDAAGTGVSTADLALYDADPRLYIVLDITGSDSIYQHRVGSAWVDFDLPSALNFKSTDIDLSDNFPEFYLAVVGERRDGKKFAYIFPTTQLEGGDISIPFVPGGGLTNYPVSFRGLRRTETVPQVVRVLEEV